MSILSQKYKDMQFIQGNRPDGMTTEQAIENLIDIKTKYTWSTGADDALDMAIKALEQEPKTDVLDKIRAEIDSHCSDNRDRNDGLYIAMKIIDKYRESEDKE